MYARLVFVHIRSGTDGGSNLGPEMLELEPQSEADNEIDVHVFDGFSDGMYVDTLHCTFTCH